MKEEIKKKLKLNPNLFVFPSKDKYILYLPLRSISVLVNADTVRLLNAIESDVEIDTDVKIVKDLEKIGVFDQTKLPFKEANFEPTSVTFLPSFVCNLNCTYCYSEGGDRIRNQDSETIPTISLDAAFTAIDLVLNNAKKQKNNKVNIGFHGGGEPLLFSNKAFIEETIAYADKKAQKDGIRVHSSVVTNGVDIDKFDVSWLKKHFSHFNLSLDGPSDIQNNQRPTRDKTKDSYASALYAIKLFEMHDIPYGIRSTITKSTVNRMREILEHFIEITSLKSFHFEPLSECGRCLTTKTQAPSQKEYVRNYLDAYDYGLSKGVNLYYSGSSLDKISDSFCGATGKNFVVTPNGNVTTCLEVSREDDLYSNYFFIGKFDSQKKAYVFDEQKIAFLQSRKVDNMQGCSDCVCKFNCSGDCLIKVLRSTGDMFDVSNNKRCKINQVIIKTKINKNHEKEKENQGFGN